MSKINELRTQRAKASMVASYKADAAWGAYSAVIYAIEDYPELAE